MNKESILLKSRDLTRHQVIERCLLSKLTNREASEALNLSVRQIQNLKKESSSLDF